MSKILDNLNNEQLAAVKKINGPVMILAGAGTGKTHTLISRTAYMIEQGIKPENILLITFTNKAAKEMKERMKEYIGEQSNKITASTFHSFSTSILRKYAKLVNLNSNFEIIDTVDAQDAITICRQEYLNEMKQLGNQYDLKSFPKAKEIQYIYEKSVNNDVSLTDIFSHPSLSQYVSYKEEILEIIMRYSTYKYKHNYVDYNDLMIKMLHLLKNNEPIRSVLDKTYQYIMCDEFQDTNIVQEKILTLLSKDYHNLAVVGDDNQSIYAFRDANIKNILEFQNKHNATEIILKENYRSSNEILNFANAVMSHATEGIPKKLNGQFNGIRPQLINTIDTQHQNQSIINKIKFKKLAGYDYSDMAVICRSASQTYYLEYQLNLEQIPYKKFGGIKYFEKAVVKDILAYLKVIDNFKDELSWFRILQKYPGIGKTYANKIAIEISKNGVEKLRSMYPKKQFSIYLNELANLMNKMHSADFQKQIKYIINSYYPRVEKRLIDVSDRDEVQKAILNSELSDNLKEVELLLNLAEKYNSCSKFLSDIVLDATTPEEDNDYVNITTIHSAKGLEYSVVFIPDAIEDVLPKHQAMDEASIAEELRCFYVAITRAKKELYIYYPCYMTTNYKSISGILSRFIDKPDVLNTLKQIDIK